MRVVNRFEANLLKIVHCVFERSPVEYALPLVRQVLPRPPCLSREALALVQQALARGTVALLVHSGGWRRERFLRGEQPAAGRLWERTPPEDLGLRFTRHSLDFLIWLTAANPGDPRQPWEFDSTVPFSVGDLWLLYRTLATFSGHREISTSLVSQTPFAEHGLCQLAYPELFAGDRFPAPVMAPWVQGTGACILETLQHWLAGQWVEVEESKRLLATVEKLRLLGLSQERVLSTFLAAAEQAGRRDLARFLLMAAQRLLHGESRLPWENLNVQGMRLADRLEAYRAAAGLLRQLETLYHWQQSAWHTGFLDDHYQAAQLYKADWEQYEGDATRQRAQALLRRLEPLAN